MLKEIVRGFRHRVLPSSPTPVLDEYVSHVYSPQAVVDLFKGEWASSFPKACGLEAGRSPLFEDGRIPWTAEILGGIEGMRVLELGPLEGGHTYMLEQAGAAEVVAVEANRRAYLKCLIVKELLGMQAKFRLAEMNAELEQMQEVFDLCVASGVLYHQQDPLRSLQLLAKVSDRLMLWTHYYDADHIRKLGLEGYFHKRPGDTKKLGDLTIAYHPREYKEALEHAGFCGGATPHVNWMQREDILAVLQQLGYAHIETGFEHHDHPNGPAFALVATRQTA